MVVRVPNWWAAQKQPRLKVEINLGDSPQSMLGLGSLLDFNVRLAIGKEPLTEEEWQELLKGTDSLVKIKGQWVEVDREKIQAVLSHWNQLKKAAREGLSISEAFRLLAGVDQCKYSDSVAEWSDVKPGAWSKTVLEQLQTRTTFLQANVRNFHGTLRPYSIQRGAMALDALSTQTKRLSCG